MLVAVWVIFLLCTLFLLGITVGSFLNVCIVRLPLGRSLIRPGSMCGHCHKPIRLQDNIPLLSYWLLHGRCRHCGAPFSMRYFWIELVTGCLFVLIYHFEVARNIHHFAVLSWYEGEYAQLLTRMFDDSIPWLLFLVHVLFGCFLIVATMTSWEQGSVPVSGTCLGVALGLTASALFPWPWPDTPEQAIVHPTGRIFFIGSESKPYTWGPHIGPMPVDAPWWQGDVTPRGGLYPWPIWGPLPQQLPPGSRILGLATGLGGIAAGAILVGVVAAVVRAGLGFALLGWGEMSLLMIAGSFLGWQPTVIAGLIGLAIGLLVQMARRQRGAYSLGLVAGVVAVWFGWYWIGPLVQGLFFNPDRLLIMAEVLGAILVVLAVLLRFLAKRTGKAS